MKYCYSFRCEVRTTTSKYSIVRDQVVLGRFYLSDNSHASVVKQPNHRAFGFGRIPFRPWAKSKRVVVIVIDTCSLMNLVDCYQSKK